MHRSAVAVCILSLCLTTAYAGEQEHGLITGDDVALRAGPGTNHPVLKRLNTDARVDVLGKSGAWIKVKARAYVGSKHIDRISPTEGKVTSSGLYVRSEPRMKDGNQVRTVSRNHVFTIVGTRGSWLEVDTHAFVHQDFVQQVVELEEIVVVAERPAHLPTERPEMPVLEIEPTEFEPIEIEPIEIDIPAPTIEDLDLQLPVPGDFPVEGDPIPAADVPAPRAELSEEQAGPGYDTPLSDEELALVEPAEMTPELEEQIMQDLLTLPLDDAYALHGEGNPNFNNRAQFDEIVQELREYATETEAPSHEIDGTYTLKPGFWIGRKPEVVVEIKQAQSGGDSFVVTHKVFDLKKKRVEGFDKKQIVKELRYEDTAIGTWDAKKRRVSVEFPNVAGATGRLSGSDRDLRIRSRYTIHTTGEIRGTYKRERARNASASSQNVYTCSSKGWREGSTVSVGGYYELKPSWYAFGYKPTVKVWLDEQEDGTFAVKREVHEKDGQVLTVQGVGQLNPKREREVNVSFGTQHPPIRYRVTNDGRIQARYEVGNSRSYTALRTVDRSGESRAERGYRNGIEIEKFPTGLRRAWASTKTFLSKSGRAVGRFGKMVGTKTWGAAKWTAGKIWDGTKWVGTKISDGAQWVWDGSKWVAVKVWDSGKWVVVKTWDGTKWVAKKSWNGIKEGGRRIVGAGKAVGGGVVEGGRILINGVPAEEVETAPVERLPIDDEGSPVIDIELGGEESEVPSADPIQARR